MAVTPEEPTGTKKCKKDPKYKWNQPSKYTIWPWQHPGTIFPSTASSHQQSMTSDISNQVNRYTMLCSLTPTLQLDPITQSELTTSSPCDIACEIAPSNSPNPELMNKLSNALGLLTTNVQEILVNCLVTTITSTDAIKSQITTVSACHMVECKVLTVPKIEDTVSSVISPMEHPPIAVSLAAAMLGALLVQ
eukprot:12520741-Ditylum_brightwellii.AAC.1